MAMRMMVWCIVISVAKFHKACCRNAHLVTSMEYQLKQITENDRCKRDCKEGTAVGFLAMPSGIRQNVPAKSIVVFNVARYNQGGAYDHKTGIFTAPSAGLYFFTWTIVTQRGKYFFTNIVLNGKTAIAYNHADGRATTTANLGATQSVVVHLKKNDEICIKLFYNIGQYMYGGEWSTFSGYKIN